jgi:hypothetical protein
VTRVGFYVACLFAYSSLSLAAVARAASGDVEIDPVAYIVDGYSLHVGLRVAHQRFDLGNFAAAAPELFHGNPGFGSYFSGLGAKWDLCRREDCNGAFAGLDVSVAHNWVTLKATGETVDRRQVVAGFRAGYRFTFRDDGKGFFVVPWASVGYSWFSHSVTLGGQTFNDRRIAVFPTIHVGYAF